MVHSQLAKVLHDLDHKKKSVLVGNYIFTASQLQSKHGERGQDTNFRFEIKINKQNIDLIQVNNMEVFICRHPQLSIMSCYWLSAKQHNGSTNRKKYKRSGGTGKQRLPNNIVQLFFIFLFTKLFCLGRICLVCQSLSCQHFL